jgi:tetratricopeptide (TPR) repeat protein
MKQDPSEAAKLLSEAKLSGSVSLAEQALKQFHRVGEPAGEAECHQFIAELSFADGDYVKAEAAYREAIRLYRVTDNISQEAASLFHLASCLAFTDNEQQQAAHLKDALSLAERLQDSQLQAQCHAGLGGACKGSDPVSSRYHFEKALDCMGDAGKGWLSGVCHQSIALLDALSADMNRAQQHLLIAIDDFEKARFSQPTTVDLRQAQCLEKLGDLSMEQPDSSKATSHYTAALKKLESRELTGIARVREKLAALSNDTANE